MSKLQWVYSNWPTIVGVAYIVIDLVTRLIPVAKMAEWEASENKIKAVIAAVFSILDKVFAGRR
jgi:hypothetical protein